MPINPDLLIAAPMLQDYLVDKDGTPMAYGIVTCYQDNSRTTLKNWYYQSSNFADANGNYTFSALPNPLTLSAAGTICDINGVDTIPFYYPYSELDESVAQPYYITIINQAGTNEITRPNFPYNRETTSPALTTVDVKNLIVNNGFWRNVQPNYINQPSPVSVTLSTPFLSQLPSNLWSGISTLYAGIVAPSQHDGFSMPDTQFVKDNLSATDAVTFLPFPLATQPVIQNYTTPEYYLQHNCSVAGSGELAKAYQFPIALHLNNLSNLPFTVSIQAQFVSGAGTSPNVISLQLLQFTGSGTTPAPAPKLIANKTITVNTAWSVYTLTDIFPSTAGLTLSQTEDDAWYLQISMPLNQTCKINFTKPSLYLTENTTPMNDFSTYDEVDSIINTPRTGDIRTSLNSFYSYGWVPMNNGTLGNASSNGTSRAHPDTFPLFNLLWNNFANFNNSTTNLLAQMVNSTGTPVAYGATAVADFNTNNAITLSPTMGQVLLGGAPSSALATIPAYKTTFTVTTNLFTAANNVSFFNGMPVYFTGTTTLSKKLIYYVANFNGTTQFNVATTFANAMAGTIVTIASDSGTVISAYQGSSEGEYAHTQLTAEVGAHTHGLLTNQTGYIVPVGGGLGSFAATAAGTAWFSAAATGFNTGGTPFNVTQKGTFFNLFIKL